MLANAPTFAPSLLCQCVRLGAASARTPQHLRTFVTSSVRRQSPPESTSHAPGWIDNSNRTRSASSLHPWQNVLHTARDYTKRTDSNPQSAWDTMEKTKVRNLPPPNNAYSGRSVLVDKKNDVGSALAKLKAILTINAVRATNIRDERHEKKGEKRNRLKSLRWRRRFAHEVRKKVQLVNEIRARGA
ncbi:hypothetical protein BD309DRAFT_879267 [Dichomitus squalens]|uniref:Uncharacterized protein n=2 Tax=Dichomitus squalens TaxID=114155 RepID=A0A4V2K622_9APHY|nr:hypothetical protein BD309DRAFT_879267 [Dichomitus squalens]TBU65939.1 hypothetical protein BD310DRAFT_865176 [Dichomitus squalens]